MLSLLFTSLFIKASFLCTCLLTYAQAENTGTENISPPKVNAIEQFLDSIKIDLPPSEVTCRATGSLSQPDIAINKEKNLLYIGESGSSGSDMIYYSVIEE